MSSRALRKAQREREEQEQLRKLEEEQESDDEEYDVPAPAAKQSLFAMLGGDEDENDDEEEEGATEESAKTQFKADPSEEEVEEESAPASKSSSKRRKKKKAKGGAKKAPPVSSDPELDDIDLALKSLSTKPSAKDGVADLASTADPIVTDICRLLAIDISHLHASNEMRRLFGRAALERDDDDDAGAAGRRRNRGQQQQLGLAAALRGRQGTAGRTSGLAALSLRRNIFVQGKDEWPVATSGGLGMEIVEKRSDGTVEYRYTHTRPYQSVQGEFETCVASMDPNRMVQLFHFNPYHISTLLQVSEIAKQERDHATSGDLLERALFSFGRSVHSTFANNLAQGKARMDFRRPENREFWLAACRYISNLGMRATWRTVYEWAKLLLSLNPENDPYCIALVLDQYAIRARSPQNFLEIADSAFFKDKWNKLANVQITKGLALVQIGEEGKGKQALFTALAKFPFVVARLFQELNLDPPPAVWGKQPRTDSEKLHTELYATRAKDIWNTPEASHLLAEVSSAMITQMPEQPVVDKQITLDEARHVLMSDIPALISHLPRSITTKVTSSSDPLPPDDDLTSYTPTQSSSSFRGASSRPGAGSLGSAAENLRELQSLYRFFAELFPWFNPNGEHNEARPQPTEDEIERRIQESGVSEELVVQRTQRLMELQTSLMAATNRAAGGDLDARHDANEAAAAARHAHFEEVEDDEED
ncbi:transcriptional repressor TCF25-domain-containing protein [Delphinella strobiligena]|nr:transcriptional repressor TCF25-domain-containing protein [Delphinella strobiligena]